MWIKLANAGAIRQRMRAPSGWREDDLSLRILRTIRSDHSGNCLAGHYIAKL
jgi:hypothetical protein